VLSEAFGIAFVVDSAAIEVSTDVVVASTNLCPSPANAVVDNWRHCRGPSEVRCSCLEAFLQWSVEDAPVEGKHKWAVYICHSHAVLCCLSSAGARLVEGVSGRGVCGCTSVFP
jgi:hypothetical protein